MALVTRRTEKKRNQRRMKSETWAQCGMSTSLFMRWAAVMRRRLATWGKRGYDEGEDDCREEARERLREEGLERRAEDVVEAVDLEEQQARHAVEHQRPGVLPEVVCGEPRVLS
jgi:hypothetical protein